MKIAFYAPMKSPDDARPSGDRTIGRLLMAALSHGGCDVRLASQLRTWSGTADRDRLFAFRSAANQEAQAIVENYQNQDNDWRPDLWFTYHSYYKAPDLLGPLVVDALRIPYVLTEASYSERRAEGPWQAWTAAARTSISAADAVFNFTERDKRGLREVCAPERLHDLAPFLDLDEIARAPSADRNAPSDPIKPVRLVTVAMMRQGAKLASYELLAAALKRLSHCHWQLDIVGDGICRGDVERAFSDIPDQRLRWHGVLEPMRLQAVLASGDLFVWPGIEEAFGMAYLEAQALGLPVAAFRTAGVPEVVKHNETGLLACSVSADAYAQCLEHLINDHALRRRLSIGARASVEANHSLGAASERLRSVLSGLVGSR